MNKQRQMLDEMLKSVGDDYRPRSNMELTLFMAAKGCLSNGELMIVGRAGNGGHGSWEVNRASDKQERDGIISKASAHYSYHNGRCPLKWVTEHWGGEYKYNTKQSQFWQVIREVSGQLGIADIESEEWPSHLIWSNLYKISPDEGGNPSGRLCDIQFDSCVRCLKQEIQDWQPKRILFLTGFDWAKSFVEDNSCYDISESTDSSGYVEATGTAVFEGGRSTVVVTPHPQTRPRQKLADDIVQAFNRCHSS
ncbi:uracil-DNA glycosylase family protein [Candidatus Sumerlaeota bacterium]